MTQPSLDPEDRLALFGYGLFETLRVSSYGLEVPELHYRRLKKGAEVLNLKLPEYSEWLNGLLQFVAQQKQEPLFRREPFAIRFTLSGGSPARGLSSQMFYQARPVPYPAHFYEEGVKICRLDGTRNVSSKLATVKSTNFLENLLAKQEAEHSGALEGIWLNTRGFIAEGSMSNIFLVRNGKLYTPSLTCGCLPGTRRFIVLECARSLGIPYEEGELTPEFLEQAEEIFLTNALMGILPVTQIGNSPALKAFQSPQSLTAQLTRRFQAYLREKSVKL